MKEELKNLIIQLSRDVGIPTKSLLAAARKAVISGRISQSDLISVLNKLCE